MVAGSYCVWFGSVFVAMVFTDAPSSETLICGLPLYINLRLLSTDKGLCIIDSAGLATGFWDIRMPSFVEVVVNTRYGTQPKVFAGKYTFCVSCPKLALRVVDAITGVVVLSTYTATFMVPSKVSS